MVLAGSTLVPLRYHRKRDGTVFPVEIAGGRFVLNGRTVIYTAIRDITERERARQELLSHERQLRALVTQLTLAEEAERQRIADGLHDDIAQTLVAARLELDRLSPGASGKVVAAVARTVGQALAQVLAQTRSMTFDLVSPTLHDHGLAFALQDLCERMAQKHGIALVFDTPTTYRPLSGDVEILLYRVVQELLLNVARHAKATQARVQLNQSEAVVCVEDDGVGFTTDNLSFSPSGGFGLFSIRERVEHLGGRLAVETVEPHGIRVLVTIPSASGPRV
jgi:signal transduction histidine kinase